MSLGAKKACKPCTVKAHFSMGGTRIFELRGSEGASRRAQEAKENCFYRTFNWGKLAAGAWAVNDRK